jgi:hypothetical protein
MTEPEYVAISYAGHVTGVPARTLRRWAEAGKVPVVAGHRKRLVRLEDVQRLAAMTGHQPARAAMTGASAGQAAGHVAAADVHDDLIETTVAVSPGARAQLEAVRDEWLQPLIDQLREAERALGRTEAERDQARQERDALQERLAGLERGEPVTDASQSEILAPQSDETGRMKSDLTEPPWRRFWRRMTGG